MVSRLLGLTEYEKCWPADEGSVGEYTVLSDGLNLRASIFYKESGAVHDCFKLQ